MSTQNSNAAPRPAENSTPSHCPNLASSSNSTRLSPAEIEELRQHFKEVGRQVQEILASREKSPTLSGDNKAAPSLR
ncbi:hypothetical protein [Paucibacter sp. DJ2R-2]|uniref:hypothetical protein n=1 Tax=Paucibacter sp. DJ2R-2 TaxID=2893558 RepID=UPI0021E41508|nr:hypothetical protein [Paucibacter sp. DJ2R-2]MCV2420279.1 hypothetical protein [Paucibacter sp. DJ4R-1]MCV2436776.1 hypothetical protein [Paucibacter sp. DJ2R-2]